MAYNSIIFEKLKKKTGFVYKTYLLLFSLLLIGGFGIKNNIFMYLSINYFCRRIASENVHFNNYFIS